MATGGVDLAPDRPTLASVFTGAGGLDIGLEQAGFITVAANDSEADCIKTLLASQEGGLLILGRVDTYLEQANILHGPIEELQPRDFRPAGVSSRWTPTLLAGGPPCQPFSSSGKMLSIDDPRGRLFEEFVRLADGLRPRMILFENVRGLVTARGPSGMPGEALSLVKRAFEDIGYATTFALLNAADFGSPQRRVRMFMIGCAVGQMPAWPAATHAEHPETGLFETREPWVTLAEFLASQPDPDPSDVVLPSIQLQPSVELLLPGSGLKTPGPREATRPGGHWGYKQGTFVADPAKPARTVTAAATQDWVRGRDGHLRRLTWRECAGLQGFPDDWRFQGNTSSRFRQIGNAVPSVFGRKIGECIIRALNTTSRGRPNSVPMPATLTMAIDYTMREHARNGESRRRAAELIASGVDPRMVKGLGSADVHTAR